jgi:hypothetical protein
VTSTELVIDVNGYYAENPVSSRSGSTFTLTARASSASHTVTCDRACF